MTRDVGLLANEACISQLALRGLSIEDLPSYCRPLEDDECLMLVGSIAEGLGNPDSDVDLLLIGARKAFMDLGMTGVGFDLDAARPRPEAEVNTETYDSEDLLRLRPVISAAAAGLEEDAPSTRPTMIGDYSDVRILHRLRSGIPLVNPEVVDQWRERLRLDLLPEFVALTEMVMHFTVREDALSHVVEGDFDAASLCLRESAGHAVGSLLATLGETHPVPRWRLKVLRQRKDELDPAMAEDLIAAMLDRVGSVAEVDAAVALFDRVIMEVLGRYPRVGKVGLQIAAQFPVHSHLAESAPAPSAVPGATEGGTGPGIALVATHPARPPSAAARRIARRSRVTFGREMKERWPLAGGRAVSGRRPGGVTVDGIPSVMLASNDYLGLRWHPAILEAAQQAVRTYGSGAGGSRLMAGSIPLHRQLEEELADLLGREAALVFPSGYQTNVGVLSTLFNRNDMVACDKGVHASLLDGLRLARSKLRRFDRRRPETLDRPLGEMGSGAFKATGIVADAIYSMAGDTLPLASIVERIGDGPDPLLLVDEAHALGVLGPSGEGLSASIDAGRRVDLVTGTLSKSLASAGGFVAGPRALVEPLYTARSMLFSTASTPATLGAALAALRIVRSEPERREHAKARADQLRAGLHELGLHTGPSDSLIVPALIGDELSAVRLAHELGVRGICAGCAVAPAVSPGRAIVRFSVTADLTESDIGRALDTLADLLPAERIAPARGEASA